MPLFAHLSYKELVRVMSITRVRSYDPKEVVIKEGEPGDELMLVLDGTIDLLKDTAYITSFERGDHFGEMALVDKRPRSATALARDEARLLIIKQEDFYRILAKEPELSVKLLWSFVKVLTERLRQTTTQLSGERLVATAEDLSDEVDLCEEASSEEKTGEDGKEGGGDRAKKEPEAIKTAAQGSQGASPEQDRQPEKKPKAQVKAETKAETKPTPNLNAKTPNSESNKKMGVADTLPSLPGSQKSAPENKENDKEVGKEKGKEKDSGGGDSSLPAPPSLASLAANAMGAVPSEPLTGDMTEPMEKMDIEELRAECVDEPEDTTSGKAGAGAGAGAGAEDEVSTEDEPEELITTLSDGPQKTASKTTPENDAKTTIPDTTEPKKNEETSSSKPKEPKEEPKESKEEPKESKERGK